MYTRDDRIMYRGEFETYKGRYLPHWDVEDGIYFVTFRLANSLPASKLRELSDEYRRRVRRLTTQDDVDAEELAAFAFEYYLSNVDVELDESGGACHLAQPEVAEMVSDSLEYFDGDRYTLYGWVIMPNHVHVVFQRTAEWSLSEVVGAWKSYTAHEARELVDYGESFWQGGYFDRLIRTKTEFRDTLQYVWRNPEEAGLGEWEWRAVGRESGSF